MYLSIGQRVKNGFGVRHERVPKNQVYMRELERNPQRFEYGVYIPSALKSK